MAAQVSPPGSSFWTFPMARVIQEDLKGLRESWFWFVLLGVILIILGMAALTYSCIATEVAVLVFGCFLAVAGVCYIIGAFFTRGWGGFFLSLLGGALYLAAGIIFIDRPLEAAILYTLVMAIFFFVDGLFRIFASLTGRFRDWGWVLFSGVVTLLLGILIWRQWPWSGLWVVGTFLGVNMIINGVSYVALGLDARKLPA
jgi:uncharacterized membrane protein HdeD (DUF308 family)